MTFRNPVREVKVAGSSTASPVRVRATALHGTNASFGEVTPPSTTQVGDLLLFFVTSLTNNVPSQGGTGRTRDLVGTYTVGAYRVSAYQLVATADDVGKTFRFTAGTGRCTTVLFVLAGAKSVTWVGGATSPASGTAAIPSPTVGAGAFFLAACVGASAPVDPFKWGNAAQGGPPAPTPGWSQFTDSSGAYGAWGVSVATWPTVESYGFSPGASVELHNALVLANAA